MRTEPSFSPDATDVDDNASNLRLSDGEMGESELLSDYRQRYGLSTDPFSDNPHFPFYTGAQRRQILDQLLHLCQFSNNVLVVLGEYGVGKTRMVQALIDALDDADDICFLEGQITSDFDSLLGDAIKQYELSDAQEFSEFTARRSENDGLAVVIVDNAHHLTDEVLEELVGLIKLGAETRVHLVLFAELHLLPRLERLDLPDITLSDFQLERFSLSEAVDYLNFRMEMADYLGPEIFNDIKVDAWLRQARGQLVRLHEYAQEALLVSVSSSGSFRINRKGLSIKVILTASAALAVLMGYLYWRSSSERPLLPEIGDSTAMIASAHTESSSPGSVPVAPVLLHEGANPVQIGESTSLEKAPLVAQASEVIAPAENTDQATLSSPSQAMPIVSQTILPANIGRQTVTSKPEEIKDALTRKIVKLETPQQAKTVNSKAEALNVKKAKSISNSNYTEQEKSILSWRESDFTLQVVGLSSEKATREYVATQPNKKDLLVFKSTRQGKDWFVVITGRYPSSSSAREASKLLPESQRKAAPWPRDLKTIQAEIKR